MKNIYQLLNYINTTVALENVKTAGIDRMALGGFTLRLRFIEIIIEYTLAYLLIGSSTNDVLMIYYVLPFLFLLEIGMSKLDYKKFLISLQFAIRVVVKFGIIWWIDRLVIILFL